MISDADRANGFFTVREAAELLLCSRDHIYKLIYAGELKVRRIGAGTKRKKNAIRIPKSEVFKRDKRK